RLEIVDVQHLSGPGGLGEARQQGLLLGHCHVLALASAARLGLERLDPAVVIGHVRPVHRAQRDTHGRCNRRLRHPALAQQYHLDALTLHGENFPAQRRLQLPDLGLAAFDHLFPLRIRWSERITPSHRRQFPSVEYETSVKTLDSISYGSGIRPHFRLCPLHHSKRTSRACFDLSASCQKMTSDYLSGARDFDSLKSD